MVMRNRWTVRLAAVTFALLAGSAVPAVHADAAVRGGQGDPGQQSKPSYGTGVTGYEIVSLAPAAVANLTPRTVSCPPGKKVLGGGARIQGSGSLAGSFPTQDGTGWTALATSSGATTPFDVFAVCAYVR
jgi:hypothetical protein